MAQTLDATPGWDHIWVTDSVISLRMYEPVVLLSACAARTSRIRLGVACMASLGFRHPLLVAQQLANLDTLSAGRLTLIACPGWATGDLVKRELAAFNVTYPQKLRQMEEGVEFLRLISADGVAALTGERFSVTELSLEPQFVQRPLPIWMVANPAPSASPETVRRLLARVARIGDAWMTYAVTPARLRELVAMLRELRHELGDPHPELFGVCVFLHANIAHDESAAVADAIAAWREVSTANVTPADLQSISAIGSPTRSAEFIAELVDAGATSIALDPVSQDRERQLEALSSTLLPLLADMN
jgi:alkanesulfonate monooxygenase SsuD/methylene tetrahydromethanopterin reductase-like flavin-dependent oxidoreductase (luciferase family)